MFHFHINNVYFLGRFITKRMTLLFKTPSQYKNAIIKLALCFLGMLLVLGNGKAQDVHLTQFNYSPLLLNAANTGNFYGDWRVGLNYRNQWAATGNPYSSAIVFGDKKFSLYGREVGGGLLFINDQSGGINRNMLYASGSYFHRLNENHFSGGLQVGMVFNSPTVTSWGVWDPTTGTWTADNGENRAIGNSSYLDVNLGLLWKRSIHIFEPEVGLSLGHLTNPNQSLMGGTDKVPLTTTLHGSLKTNVSDELYLLPTLMVSNSRNNLLSVVGVNAGYKLLGNRSSVKELFGGVYARNGIAGELSDIAILVGTTVGRLDVALSYDLNAINFGQQQNVSSFEISLIYKSISTVLNSYSIPCERF